MTLKECEDTARRCALSLPPSDFGSKRAIQAFAQTLRVAILKEREACIRIAKRERSDCDSRGAIDMETGEVPCSMERRGGNCECVLLMEHGEEIASLISKRG